MANEITMANEKNVSCRAFLVGLREDGSPTCHPMTGVMIHGEPQFNTYRKSAKARNFLRDPRAAVALLDDWTAAPATAHIRTGFIVETEAPERPDTDRPDTSMPDSGRDAVADSLNSVPDSVKNRVQSRVESGKRIYFRLARKN